MAEIDQWTILIPATIIRLAACAVVIYWAAKFRKHRHNIPLQKRHPFLILLITINMLSHIAIYNLFQTFIPKLETEYGHAAIVRVRGALYGFCNLHPTGILIVARLWIIFFNMRHGVQLQKAQWSVHIDGSSADSFWFIRHKKDYGSYAFIQRVCIIGYLIEAALITTCFWVSLPIGLIVDSLLYLVEFFLIPILWFKTPHVYDHFGIKQETKYILYSVLLFMALKVPWMTIDQIAPSFVLSTVMNVAASLALCIVALVYNSYIFVGKYKYLLSNKRRLESPRETTGTKQLTLEDTLKDERLVDAFMKHLSDEFSIELLLAYIEFKQFEALMRSDKEFMNGIPVDNETSGVQSVELSASLPLSHIVYKKYADKEEKYLLIAHDLFNKYVDHSSAFEINISYGDRQQISAFIEEQTQLKASNSFVLSKEDRQRLYALYHNASEAVCMFMAYSHVRFARNRSNAVSV